MACSCVEPESVRTKRSRTSWDPLNFNFFPYFQYKYRKLDVMSSLRQNRNQNIPIILRIIQKNIPENRNKIIPKLIYHSFLECVMKWKERKWNSKVTQLFRSLLSTLLATSILAWGTFLEEYSLKEYSFQNYPRALIEIVPFNYSQSEAETLEN